MEFIFQLCIVPLDADVLAHLNVMNPSILEEWQLSFVPPPPSGIEDAYRFITSTATRCPDQQPVEKVDPYAEFTFWTVDLTDRFSSELSQFSLGRRFIYQTGLITNGKRLRPISTSTTKRASKKRRIK